MKVVGAGGAQPGAPTQRPSRAAAKRYAATRSVTVDLDAAPQARWRSAALSYKRELLGFADEMREAKKEIGAKRVRAMVRVWETAVRRIGMGDVVEEVTGLCEAVGLGRERDLLVLAQLQYELAVAGCTSLLLRTETSGVAVARTLDWDGLLSPLVATVVFTRGTRVVARCPSFVGLLGCTTGATAGEGEGPAERFAVALNHRPEGEDVELVCEAAMARALDARWRQAARLLPLACPVALLLRQVLTGVHTCAEVVARLVATPLIASAYFLVGGEHGEAVLITRNRHSPDARGEEPPLVRRLGGAPWSFLVQCNHDAAEGAEGAAATVPPAAPRSQRPMGVKDGPSAARRGKRTPAPAAAKGKAVGRLQAPDSLARRAAAAAFCRRAPRMVAKVAAAVERLRAKADERVAAGSAPAPAGEGGLTQLVKQTTGTVAPKQAKKKKQKKKKKTVVSKRLAAASSSVCAAALEVLCTRFFSTEPVFSDATNFFSVSLPAEDFHLARTRRV